MDHGEAWCLGIFLSFVCIGTTILFIASLSYVYHEARVWGLAFALASVAFSLRFLEKPSGGRLALAITCATLSILAAVPMGISATVPLMLLGGILAVGHLVSIALSERLRRLQWVIGLPAHFGAPSALVENRRLIIALALASFVPVLLMVAVNQTKYGTVFNVPFDHHVAWTNNPARMAILEENGGTLNLRFIPTNLRQWIRTGTLEKDTIAALAQL